MRNYEQYIFEIRLDKELPEDSYLRDVPAIMTLKQKKLTLDRPVTFFVGENGSGKSTLLEAIAVQYGFNPEGGTRDYGFSTAETHSELYKYITLAKRYRPKDGFFLRAESFYNFATDMDERRTHDPRAYENYGGRSLHTRSHGEGFAELVSNRFFGKGVYILDEPEAALSISKQYMLLAKIHALVNDESQFIIATHSPILTGYPNAEIYEFSEYGIEKVSYEQTDNYRLTKEFVNNREHMCRLLFEEE
ncbi:MAG: AAA family ATPase [Candidatus Ornithomonoglobus sp.]